MSMIGYYRKLSRGQLDALVEDPRKVEDFLYPDDGDYSSDALDIDKSWHLIHFLLTGETWGGEYPLANAVLGGDELPGTDTGYGPFRYLDHAEVKATSRALARISAQQLWSRFNAARVQAADIYPAVWTGDDDDKGYISRHYEALRQYFVDAAASGNAMLLYLS